MPAPVETLSKVQIVSLVNARSATLSGLVRITLKRG